MQQNKKEEFEASLHARLKIEGSPGKHITVRMHELHIPTASITVIENNEISWTQEYYTQSNKSKNFQPAIFQAASFSKIITAVLAMKLLVEPGLIGLDDDVNKYLKGWNIPNSFDEKVSLRRLLSHTAGINVGGLYGYPSAYQKIPTIADVLIGNSEVPADAWPPPEYPDGIPNNPPVKVTMKPGAQEFYSGGGTTIIQKLIEDMIGEPFSQLAKKHIFSPFNMNSSTFETLYPGRTKQNIQAGHDLEGKIIQGQWRIYPELAAVGLWTTSSDFAKFCVAILKCLNSANAGFISQATAKAMIQKQPNSQFGLGFETYQFGEVTAFGHGGTNVGYKCGFVILPDKKAGIVIMTNSENGSQLIDECKRSFFSTYKVAFYPTTIKKSVALNAEQLKKCSGKYQFTVQETLCSVDTETKNSNLYIKIPFPFVTSNTTKEIKLISESDHAFFSSEENMTVVFNEDYAQLEITKGQSQPIVMRLLL